MTAAYTALPGWVALIIPAALFGVAFIALAFSKARDVINESRDEIRRKRQQP